VSPLNEVWGLRGREVELWEEKGKAVSSWGLADTLTGIQTIFSTMTLRDIIRATLVFENTQVALEQRRYDADSG
jgi:nitrate reductase NapAB chaperone NapD